MGYRAKSLLRVSQAFAGNGMDEFALRCLPRQQQRQALLDLYGIGPASVEYILFDVFHHFDQLDHISPWEQKIYSRLFFGVDPATPISAAELQRFFEARFGDYQALAVHYLWEDLFWQRQNQPVPWLEELIRL